MKRDLGNLRNIYKDILVRGMDIKMKYRLEEHVELDDRVNRAYE